MSKTSTDKSLWFPGLLPLERSMSGHSLMGGKQTTSCIYLSVGKKSGLGGEILSGPFRKLIIYIFLALVIHMLEKVLK